MCAGKLPAGGIKHIGQLHDSVLISTVAHKSRTSLPLELVHGAPFAVGALQTVLATLAVAKVFSSMQVFSEHV
jgi:hypothetical protein